MNDNGSFRPIVMTMILALSACLLVSEATARGSAAEPEVFVCGQEQAVVDAIIKASGRPADRNFPNDLDRAFAVLLGRAFPTPDARDLARHTVAALCREVETLTRTEVPESQRGTWVAAALQAKSFESVLNDMEATRWGNAKRERLVNAGLAEMLRATGSKCATVLSAQEARQLTQMLEARGSSSQEAGGDKALTVDVRRAPLAAKITASVVGAGVVCIRIPTFEGSGIAEKVKELTHKHVSDTTSGLILDLRDNPGGRPEEANAVADLFLADKCLQIFQFRNGRRIAFKSKPGAVDVRIVVLTDRNTASAAEMLAMALRDHHRATVVGQPTAGFLFGKDGEKLSDGRMIVFRSEPTVLSPLGNDYSETGVPPDMAIDESRSSGGDKTMDRAIQLLRGGQER